jgi:Transposase
MCLKPNPGDKVVAVHCRPKTFPCPLCGRRGRRKRRLHRYVRSIAYGQALWLHVFYAEYTARCDCRKSFRSWVAHSCPKAEYDNLVRQAVLNRVLDDRQNVETVRAAMKRDFLLDLSSGFIYDCLDWGLRRLNQAGQRRLDLQHFSGYTSIDELHLGEFTLLLATDPIADRIIGYRLVKVNDSAHMRCFLRTLAYWGFEPKVVVTDGSNLYPAVLAEVWPAARHQLCVFHVLQDVTNKVLDAVRRLRRGQARRGKAGRKRRRGRQSEKQKRRARRRGPSNKEKAAFVYKHRFLIVKRTENLTKKEWETLGQMFQYLPQLRPLWYFCRDVYQLFNTEQVIRLARRRRTLLLKKASYQEVPELVKAMGLLEGAKFDKMVAFLECPGPAGQRVRTNNHVERANRKLRYDEKVRYKFRTERSLDRFLRLRLGLLGQSASTMQVPVKVDPGKASAPGELAVPAGMSEQDRVSSVA